MQERSWPKKSWRAWHLSSILNKLSKPNKARRWQVNAAENYERDHYKYNDWNALRVYIYGYTSEDSGIGARRAGIEIDLGVSFAIKEENFWPEVDWGKGSEKMEQWLWRELEAVRCWLGQLTLCCRCCLIWVQVGGPRVHSQRLTDLKIGMIVWPETEGTVERYDFAGKVKTACYKETVITVSCMSIRIRCWLTHAAQKTRNCETSSLTF